MTKSKAVSHVPRVSTFLLLEESMAQLLESSLLDKLSPASTTSITAKERRASTRGRMSASFQVVALD